MEAREIPRKSWRALISAMAANVTFIPCGLAMSWSSPALPKLQEEWNMSSNQGAWYVSIFGLGGIIGPLIVGFLASKIGRKWTLIGNVFLFLLSLVCFSFPDSLVLLYLGRFVGGAAAAASFISVPLYVTEIADDKMRHSLGSMNEIPIGIGTLVAYSVGPFVSYYTLLTVGAIISCLAFLPLLALHESPHYLISKGRKKAAIKVLKWIKGGVEGEEVSKEIKDIQTFFEDSQLSEGKLVHLFVKKAPRRGLILSFLLVLTPHLAGFHIIQHYSETLFKQAKMAIPSSVGLSCVGVVTFIAVCFTPWLVKRIKLKFMYTSCGFIISLSLFLLGIYFYLDRNGLKGDPSLDLVPIITMTLIVTLFSAGQGPLSWVILMEMFPADLKGKAVSLVGGCSWALGFLTTFLFNDLKALLRLDGLFLLFGVTQLVGSILVFRMLPDTTGKSFSEVQKILETS